MSLNDKIILKILDYLDKMNSDEEFKKTCPNITPQEYLCVKVQPYIKPKRLINILTGKVKRIRLDEVDIISKVLNVDVTYFFKD